MPELFVVNPWHAWLLWLSFVSVCLSVCLSDRTRTPFTSHESLHKRYHVFCIEYTSKMCGVFSETAAFWSYTVKTK